MPIKLYLKIQGLKIIPFTQERDHVSRLKAPVPMGDEQPSPGRLELLNHPEEKEDLDKSSSTHNRISSCYLDAGSRGDARSDQDRDERDNDPQGPHDLAFNSRFGHNFTPIKQLNRHCLCF